MTLKQRIGQWLFLKMPITRFLFDLLRFEVNAFWVEIFNHLSLAQRRKLKNLRAMNDVRVNVACGPHVAPGLVNLDLFATSPEIIRWDCRWTLPFRDDSVAGIRAEQFVEHLETREELPSFLADCLRVLKPGGVLRVIVPDARRYIEAYLRPDLSGFEELKFMIPFPPELPKRMDVLSHIFHQEHEHRHGYDFENLSDRLVTAGFVSVTRVDFRQGYDPALNCDREVHAPYSLYVEAFKPAA